MSAALMPCRRDKPISWGQVILCCSHTKTVVGGPSATKIVETSSVTTYSEESNKTVIRWSQSAIKWGHVGNDMQLVCDNTPTNCDKATKIANLLPFTYKENHKLLKFSWKLIDFKQKFRNCSTNCSWKRDVSRVSGEDQLKVIIAC